MPKPGQRLPARLYDDLTLWDVESALNRPDHLRQETQVDELLLHVVSPSGSGELLMFALYRQDDSFVWWVWGARLANADEAREWKKR